MEKIVVSNASSKGYEMLIACLRILFPECQIQLHSKGMESLEEIPDTQGRSTTREKRKTNGKHPNCR